MRRKEKEKKYIKGKEEDGRKEMKVERMKWQHESVIEDVEKRENWE